MRATDLDNVGVIDGRRRKGTMVVDRPKVERIKIAEADRQKYAEYYGTARDRIKDFIRARSREDTFDIVALAIECYMQGWIDATYAHDYTPSPEKEKANDG